MNNEQKHQTAEPLLESVSKTQIFFNTYKKHLMYAAIAILVVGVGSAAYYFFGYAPAKNEAQTAMIQPERYFAEGNYASALNGDGNNIGFADIIDTFGGKTDKIAFAYAGICELKLKNYENALGYFEKYDSKEPIMKARVIALKGDAYCGLEKYEEAVKCYKNAVKVSESSFNAEYLLSAGVACEKLGKTEEALSYYRQIKENYPLSVAGSKVDKYISRIETLLAK